MVYYHYYYHLDEHVDQTDEQDNSFYHDDEAENSFFGRQIMLRRSVTSPLFNAKALFEGSPSDDSIRTSFEMNPLYISSSIRQYGSFSFGRSKTEDNNTLAIRNSVYGETSSNLSFYSNSIYASMSKRKELDEWIAASSRKIKKFSHRIPSTQNLANNANPINTINRSGSFCNDTIEIFHEGKDNAEASLIESHGDSNMSDSRRYSSEVVSHHEANIILNMKNNNLEYVKPTKQSGTDLYVCV